MKHTNKMLLMLLLCAHICVYNSQKVERKKEEKNERVNQQICPICRSVICRTHTLKEENILQHVPKTPLAKMREERMAQEKSVDL